MPRYAELVDYCVYNSLAQLFLSDIPTPPQHPPSFAVRNTVLAYTLSKNTSRIGIAENSGQRPSATGSLRTTTDDSSADGGPEACASTVVDDGSSAVPSTVPSSDEDGSSSNGG